MILVLLWLCVMLPHLWPNPPGGMPKTPTDPIKPKRKRSTEPQPFEGLTKKPHCALCERDTVQPQPPSPVPPDSMAPTNRRPREVDTSKHFCPHSGCDFWGWLGLGNLRANGHPNGGPWRQFHCTSCEGYFLETQGTIFHGKQAAVELIVRVLACLAEGLGIRATARVFEVEPHTVLHWLVEAAEQLRAFSRYFLCDVHVEQLRGFCPAPRRAIFQGLSTIFGSIRLTLQMRTQRAAQIIYSLILKAFFFHPLVGKRT